jgi:2-polyprenyl-3-methyl-5-hydroxy-6-metoxy-1,4-benzoquinol methylase
LCASTSLRALPPPSRWIGRDYFWPHRGVFGLSCCRSCSFVFVNPRPHPELLASFYTGNAYACHSTNMSDAALRQADQQLGLIERHGPFSTERRLLDFGCGGGHLLLRARERGWDAVGFDTGPRALETCRKLGLPVVDSVAVLPRGKFDAILLSHVFEHLEDHRGMLNLFRELLGPQGKVLIEVPNARSLRASLSLPWLSQHCGFDERYRAFPIHLSYFSAATLRAMLERQSFRVLRLTTTGWGLEEILYRDTTPPERRSDPAPAAPVSAPASSRPAGFTQRLKGAIKPLFFDRLLGDNLVAVAAPAA